MDFKRMSSSQIEIRREIGEIEQEIMKKQVIIDTGIKASMDLKELLKKERKLFEKLETFDEVVEND